MKDMIGYCGLDCEKCDAYLATINDDQVLREKTAKLWAELNNAPHPAGTYQLRGLPRERSENSILRAYVRNPEMCFEKRCFHLRRLSGIGNLHDYWGDPRT